MPFTIGDIEVLPGVRPSTEDTTSATNHFVAADKIRFVDGRPEKIGGWQALTPNGSATVNGCCRALFSYTLSNSIRYLLGTHTRLYYLIGTTLTNITPVVPIGSAVAVANSLNSNYATLGSDPVATVSGSNSLTITDTATKVRVGDTITLSGAADTNGVPAAEINTTHFVRTQTTNSYTFFVTTNATSTGSGGGASVVQATPIITLNEATHGREEGDRIKIAGATTFAGIPAGDINIEHIIRNVQTNSFDFVVDTTATSSVSNGGGAGTTIQGHIAEGLCDATAAQGYGAGLYGVGLYGTALLSASGAVDARSWVFDRFGNNIVMTPGQQTGVYTWDSDTAAAPAPLTNAPTAVNYVFVSNEIIVTLGEGGVPNRIKWSDQGAATGWTAAATNQAGSDDIEGASPFVSHIKVKSINLIFTDSQVYSFRYIGRPLVWETRLLDEKSGIIAKNARVQHNGIAYWMGSDNFYYYRSGNVDIIPSNSTNETTLKKYVFDNLNVSQKSKIFAWFNRKFNEVWWHYPSEGSTEPDRIVRFNVKDFTWTPDTMERSAGEYPTQLQDVPLLTKFDVTSLIYQHEATNNDNGVAMAWSLSTPFSPTGYNTANITKIIPDSIQTGDITCTVNVKKYPQSTSFYGTKALTISPTTECVNFRENSRYVQYQLTGSVLNQQWRGGQWSFLFGQGGKR